MTIISTSTATTRGTPLASRPPAPALKPWRMNTFRALRHRNYRLYFGGMTISLIGSWVQGAALTWMAYDLTGQSSWTAFVSAAQILPMLLLAVWGGSLADRWARRPLIFLAQSSLLFLSLLLALSVGCRLITPMGLLILALLMGVANAIDTPARLAFVLDLVGREDLINAVALNSLMFNLARALGPALAGLVLPLIGYAGCFLLNSLTYLAVLAALLAMHLPPSPEPRRLAAKPSLLEGFLHLREHYSLILLLLLAAAMAFFSWPLLALLPAFADRQLHAGTSGYTLMLSAIGVGALLGALTVASFGTASRRRGFLAAGIVLTTAALLELSLTSWLSSAVFGCGLAGYGMILFFATGQGAMQLGASEHNRGRVMGIWLMVLSGAQPLGNLVAGPAADWLGERLILALGAAGVLGSALGVWGCATFWLRYRVEDSRTDSANVTGSAMGVAEG